MQKVNEITKILEDKKATNISLIDFEKRNILADYFIICEVNNTRQMDAIKNEFIKLDKENKLNVRAIEGSSDSGWVVIDTEGIFIHIFDPKTRNEYALDKLWIDYQSEDV